MNQPLLYSKYNGLQKTDAKFVLDNYFRLINWRKDGTESILDIGCGVGDVTSNLLLPLLPEKFEKLIGADKSTEMIEFAKSRCNDERVTFERLDIAANSINVEFEEAFDHILSFYCLHWIQDQRRALENISTMLKPGGDILTTFLASNPIYHIYENLAHNSKWSDYMKDRQKYTSPLQNSKEPDVEFGQLLKSSGYYVHLCKVVQRKYVYPDLEILRKSVIAVNPFLENIPSNLHSEYLSDYIAEVRNLKYIEYNANNNEEKVSVPYSILVVLASKPL